VTLEELVRSATEIIGKSLSIFKRPVIMSSFGKDSMVMLDILKRNGLKLPIVFFKEPFFPKKYEFAFRQISDNEYVVYDYPPTLTTVAKNNGVTEIINHYQAGNNTMYVPTGIRECREGTFLCGLKDLYLKPSGTFAFPWDLAFVGHKSSDIDPILGPVPILNDIKLNVGACSLSYPLRHFTDIDIWDYHLFYDVPYNDKRYNKNNHYKEFEDITYNNDYHPACTRCMNPVEADVVDCPMFGLKVTNVSKQLRWQGGLSGPRAGTTK